MPAAQHSREAIGRPRGPGNLQRWFGQKQWQEKETPSSSKGWWQLSPLLPETAAAAAARSSKDAKLLFVLLRECPTLELSVAEKDKQE